MILFALLFFLRICSIFKVVREPRGNNTNNNNVGLRRMRNRVAVERESSEEEPQEQPVEEQPDAEEEKGPKPQRFVGKAANLSKKKLKKMQDKEERAKYREVFVSPFFLIFYPNTISIWNNKRRKLRKKKTKLFMNA